VSLSKIPRPPQSIREGNKASPVRICVRPVKLLQFSDVDFQGLSHRSILDDVGEKADERDDQLAGR
jgi:hypothetical protein